jgi:hypothetical protein
MATKNEGIAVPVLNFSKLPAPVKVYYPTPKNAAPQAHPGGKHLVHRSWPLPPAPAPKVLPKDPSQSRFWKELNEKPKQIIRPPPSKPYWFSTGKDNMQPSRHLKGVIAYKFFWGHLMRAVIQKTDGLFPYQ